MLRIPVLILAAACVSAQAAPVENGALTPDRLWAASTSVLALIGVAAGWLALNRTAGRSGSGKGRKAAIAATMAGLIAVASGGMILATADGGLGTGNGIAGAVVAMVLGVIGIVLGRMALARSRRSS